MEVVHHDNASTTLYMPPGNPSYQNMQSVVVYVPRYGISGYPLSIALLCSIMVGFPSQCTMHMVLDNTVVSMASNKSA